MTFQIRRLSLAFLLGLLACAVSGRTQTLPVIPTRQHPVTNIYHGVGVVDNYQWLEDASSPEVRDWMRQQNDRTRTYFSRLPYREGIAQQLLQLRSEESARYFGLDERKGKIFALRFKPPAQQPVLVRLSSLNPPALWRTVFDPNSYNTNGSIAIDWYVPSPDGRLVAISLSEGGSEQGTLHFFEVDTGKELEDKIPRVQYPTGGGSAAWLDDGSGILYTRYPHEGERPEADVNFYQQVWFHKLGTPISEDKVELEKDLPRIAEIMLEKSENSSWILATVANGDGGDFAHYLRDTSGKWRQLTLFQDGIKSAKLGRDNAIYMLSRDKAPHGKLLRLSLDTPELSKAVLIVPEGKGVIQEFAPCDDGVYVANLIGGPSELLYFPKGNLHGKEIPILPISSVAGLQSRSGNDLVFGNSSYVKPFAWFTFNPAAKEAHRTALALTSSVDFDDIELHLVQDIEHVILEVGIGLVDLVDQQHHPLVGHEGLADLAHADVFRDVADLAGRIAETAVVQTGQGIVLVEGIDQLHARLDVQHQQRHPQALGDGVGQHGLAGARLSLEQERHLQCHGDVDDLGKFLIQYIAAGTAEALKILVRHVGKLLVIMWVVRIAALF